MDGQTQNTNPAADAMGMRPGPALTPETELRERMNEESPDGRPPSAPVRRESKLVFWSVFTLVAVIVIAALIWDGGVTAGIVAAALIVLFVGIAAWSAWHAALDRRFDERRVTDELRVEHRSGHAGRPV
jgi:hypothetical protein